MRAWYYTGEEVKELVKFDMVLRGKDEDYRGEVSMVVERNDDRRKRRYSLESIDVGVFTNDKGDVLPDELINREMLFEKWSSNKE